MDNFEDLGDDNSIDPELNNFFKRLLFNIINFEEKKIDTSKFISIINFIIDSSYKSEIKNIIEFESIVRLNSSDLLNLIEHQQTTYFDFEPVLAIVEPARLDSRFRFSSPYGLALNESSSGVRIDFTPSSRLNFSEAKITDSLYQAYKSLEGLFVYLDSLTEEERARLEQLEIHGTTNYHMALAALRFGFNLSSGYFDEKNRLKTNEGSYHLTGKFSNVRIQFETLKAAGVGERLDRRYVRYHEVLQPSSESQLQPAFEM